MQVAKGLEAFRGDGRPVSLALGTFDGVHLGHQAVLGRARAGAQEMDGRSAVLTFDPHPLRVVAPPPEPILLTTIEERLDLFAGLGMDAAIVVRFDEQLRKIPAERWPGLLAEHIGPAAVYVGADYAFGRDRQGTTDLLRRLGPPAGFEVTVVPPVHIGGTLVSSTLLRRLIRSGQVHEAAPFLGRWYELRGEVVEGERRGRTLGFPTANLAVHPDKVLPARGIYAAWAQIEERAVKAAVSVGTRPTFGPGQLLVEAHLLDVSPDLYGRVIAVQFVERLRGEIAFRTVADLVRQMEDDVATVRGLLLQ